ncbi:chemotaxis protein methyltransferase [bacterium BMS3Bbin12]|nr:chemotaxis protein methyltransferase [bacterium BMS3Bbin12]GBE50585.1 chemotaxis protein methyltransferase [bacterium BMS3Bbin13]HDJ86779.1 protein-glutamate O-methyltransferase CheR [Chromatiales bacterium]HDO34001.1 protein-glutamate O-methyltransferase CheR [Chromatiales bacterium]
MAASENVRFSGSPRPGSLPAMTDGQFRQWAQLLEERTGIVVPPERKSFLATSIALRMREIGCDDLQEYHEFLLAGRHGAVEWAVLLDRLTVHETRFFRHPPSFRLIRERFLPIEGAAGPGPHSYNAWSIGCATGEEPYGLAMLIDEHLSGLGGEYYFGVTATDISYAALGVGRLGVYGAARLKDVPPPLRARYFNRLDDQRSQVRDALRRRVCFAYMNVLDLECSPLPKMNLILCQNVLIYLDRTRRMELVGRLADHLRPGGGLVLAPGDLLAWRNPGMERVVYPDTLAYRRRDDAEHNG